MKFNTILLTVSILTLVASIIYLHVRVPITSVVALEVSALEADIQEPSVVDYRPSVYGERIRSPGPHRPPMDANPATFYENAPPREYRPAPVREWKPPAEQSQQMGLLVAEDGEMRPLYGRASKTHRDRWNYWTTSGGENLYSVPIEVDGRACEEDIGCQELYGNEEVTVTGSDTVYKPKLYRVDNYF